MTSFFKISTTPSEELKTILRENIIGTPGKGMLYQHTTSDEKIERIRKPCFVNLIRFKKILGTCTFSERDTFDNGTKHNGVYLRYFHFDTALRRRSSRTISKVGSLRTEIEMLLSGQLFDIPEKHFHYAYYDPGNERSVLFCKQYRFEEVRSFTTILFTRASPKKSSDKISVQELSNNEVTTVKQLLSSYYNSYSMFSFENLFCIGKYYVAKDSEGTIVAGVQVNPDRWKLLSLKPPFGKLKLNIASKIPMVNTVVARHLSFLAIEGVYCREGHEHDLQALMEYLLYSYKKHVAILFADEESSLKQLFDRIDLGIIGKMNSGNCAKVICRFQGFNDNEKKVFYTQPAYISSIDVT